jgi:hypothetical protein
MGMEKLLPSYVPDVGGGISVERALKQVLRILEELPCSDDQVDEVNASISDVEALLRHVK